MIYLALIFIIGLAMGVFSFFEQKLFLILMTMALIASFPFAWILPLFGYDMAPKTSPTGQSEGFFIDMLNLYRAIYDFMPEWGQLGLWVLPAAVVMGRLLTWVYYTANPDGFVTHTDADKRAKTIAHFSYKRDRHGR